MAVTAIAEIGVNHSGSLSEAEKLVSAAANAGADVVKFQTFRVENLAAPHAALSGAQLGRLQAYKTQQDALRPFELSFDEHRKLLDVTRAHGMDFLSTPFDLHSSRFLASLGLRRVKVSSGDITNGPLLEDVATRFDDIYLSTGMSTIEEIAQALAVIALSREGAGLSLRNINKRAQDNDFSNLETDVTLLHCNSAYPSPLMDLNIRAVQVLHDSFGLPVGFSDHSLSVLAPSIAVAVGAEVVEKHLTLSRQQTGLDHAASLEPHEFRQMVDYVRETEQVLGRREKFVTDSELQNISIGRRGLYATRDMEKGEIISEEDLLCIRPRTGVSPLAFWDYIGKPCIEPVRAGAPINWDVS